MTRWAVVSDIHGNLPALQAVLADARAQGTDGLLNLGDIASGPLWPRETVELLMSLPAQTIAGNHERQLLAADRARMGASDRFAAERLDAAQQGWLAALPTVMRPEAGLLCLHASPTSDLENLLETVTPDFGTAGSPGVREASAAEVRDRLASLAVPEVSLVLCGHTHMPRARIVDPYHLANPGSVGLPAFDHDQPFRHHMQTGSPHARYAIVEREAVGWRIDLRRVDYDWAAAADKAEAEGFGDWADALRTGRVGRTGSDLPPR